MSDVSFGITVHMPPGPDRCHCRSRSPAAGTESVTVAVSWEPDASGPVSSTEAVGAVVKSAATTVRVGLLRGTSS
ncbi:unannotated protein [freshwater metagenome]|uniref:Unannotated protein n=1 Tax=freshwater metagenome TaxID=449393 RepID=A0A6J6NSY5_9ZZZZ